MAAPAPGPGLAAGPPARVPTPLLRAPTKPTTTADSVPAAGNGKGGRPTPTPAAPALDPSQSQANPELRQQQQGQPRRPGGRSGTATADPLSDKSTALLIRRVLCPQEAAAGGGEKGARVPAPIEELLPPLTSRNDVDLQLYALIAIILREFVQSWYGKISPDEDFVAEIVQVIAHCTRALEQRLRKVDLEGLLFDELPDLLDKHVHAYRTAHRPMVGPPLDTNPRQIYHSLCPLPALSPVPSRTGGGSAGVATDEWQQAENEAAYRQLLVQGVLAVLLPTEDLENPCLTALVGQIFSELIIGGVVAGKVSQPWMVWEILMIVARVTRPKTDGNSNKNNAVSTADATSEGTTTSSRSYGLVLQRLFWTVLQMGFLLFSLLRALVTTLATYRSVPSRLAGGGAGGGGWTPSHISSFGLSKASTAYEGSVGISQQPVKMPVLAFRLWPTLSNLIEMDCRMPWLQGSLSLLQWIAITGPGQLAGLDGPVDRIISHAIARHVLNPAQLPPLLRTLRGTLFPNNAMGKPSLFPPSSEQELLALRRRCARSLLGLVPSGVGALYFGGAAASQRKRSTKASGGLGSASIGGGQARRPQQHHPVPSSSRPPTSLRTGPNNGVFSSPPNPPTGESGEGRPRTHTQIHKQGPEQEEKQARGLDDQPSHDASAHRGADASKSDRANGDDGDGDQMGAIDASDAGLLRGGASPGAGAPGRRGEGVVEDDDDVDADDQERILSEIEQDIVDVFSDSYCNKHLVYGVLELVLVRLMPELSEKGIIDLWSERLS